VVDSTLPVSVDYFHSLVPLDTNNQRNSSTFGYVTWSYKATSAKDGKHYTLRRLEGYRLTNEKAIAAMRPWKRVNSGGIVTVLEAFTTRDFGDSSLIFVTDYHPNSKTIADTYLNHHPAPRFPTRQSGPLSEPIMWSFMVQLASALKVIHAAGLAAQTILPSKVLITSKNRIRINGCGILDVVKFDSTIPIEDKQQEDFVQLGRLLLSIATNANAALNINKAMDHISRVYNPKLKEVINWLLQPTVEKSVDQLISGISSEMAATLDMQLHADDTLTSTLMAELENGRLVRLMTKLGLVNERPEFEHNPQWSETGERYYLKLFRDYVFHAVDEQGRPVTDMSHILACLNKLDAGSSENVTLISRDEQTALVVSYKDLKKGLEGAFNELSRGSSGVRGR
jgi:PAB-dependent poly(A)-specific ribonuclease subunit 3